MSARRQQQQHGAKPRTRAIQIGSRVPCKTARAALRSVRSGDTWISGRAQAQPRPLCSRPALPGAPCIHFLCAPRGGAKGKSGTASGHAPFICGKVVRGFLDVLPAEARPRGNEASDSECRPAGAPRASPAAQGNAACVRQAGRGSVPLPSYGVLSHVGRQARPPSDAIAFTCPLVHCAGWSLGVPVDVVGELEAGVARMARCDRSAGEGRAARVTLYDIASLPKA